MTPNNRRPPKNFLPGPLQKFGNPCIRNKSSLHLRGGDSQGHEYQEAGVFGSCEFFVDVFYQSEEVLFYSLFVELLLLLLL